MLKYLNPNKIKLISKGVDSVRSRVLNLKEQFPNLTKDLIFDTIINKFKHYHNVNDIEYKEIEDESNITNDIVNRIYKQTSSWEWLYGESPEFTNSLIHKFSWGLVDISIKVEKGKIIKKDIFSDCLITEFIDIIKEKFITEEDKEMSYDREGFDEIMGSLKRLDGIREKREYMRYIEEMEETLVKYI